MEHIDNPKGYGEGEGDPIQFHPKLRPPVNPEELEIDPHTGMKASSITSSGSIRILMRDAELYGDGEPRLGHFHSAYTSHLQSVH